LATLGSDTVNDLWRDFESGELEGRGLASNLRKDEVAKVVQRTTPRLFATLLVLKEKEMKGG
jgi:hypothetical protein